MTTASAPEAGRITANQTVIRGRVTEVKRTENACYTDVTLPAVDQYSSPAHIRIVSNRLIGKPGEDISQRCELRGYKRSYTSKTGEKGYAVDNILQAVEG